MQDLIVRLIDLPDIADELQLLQTKGIIVRRPIAAEYERVSSWVLEHFSAYWHNEVSVALHQVPARCFIAQRENDVLGFSCYETTALNYFGPTGVHEEERGQGIGKVLLIKALQALKDMGYSYAIIGGVGPVEYYRKTVGAEVIEGSERSIYNDMLKYSSRED